MTFDLAPVRTRFIDGLGRRHDELDGLLDVVAAANDRDLADTVRRGFHSIAGIGGTCGFPELTEIASEGETVCDIVLASGTPFTPTVVASARHCIAEMKAFRSSLRGSGLGL
jgi:chemotaxis protein histidine kinase CheA